MIFTIAIPTYNKANTLCAAIESALAQSYEKDYEILVVDNASEDATPELLEKYIAIGVRVIRNISTVSLFENHNICLREAKGDYVTFCHSDDRLSIDALKLIEKALTESLFPNKFVLWGRSLFRDYYSAYKISGLSINQVCSGSAALSIFTGGGLTPSGTTYSRVSFLEDGGFLPMRDRQTFSDMSTMLLMAFNGYEFLMIDRLLFYRYSANTAINMRAKYSIQSKIDGLLELKSALGVERYTEIISNIVQNRKYINFDFFYAAKRSGINIPKKTLLRLFVSGFIERPLEMTAQAMVNWFVLKAFI